MRPPDLLVYSHEDADQIGDRDKCIEAWYLVSENDRMINPDLERFMAKCIGVREVVSVPASHASLVSHPNEVAKLIMDAANSTAI